MNDRATTPPAGDLISREAAIAAMEDAEFGEPVLRRIRALPAAQGQEGEPVLWQQDMGDGYWATMDHTWTAEDCAQWPDTRFRPLYAHPATPAPVSADLDALVSRAYDAANTCVTKDDAIIRELADALRAQQSTADDLRVENERLREAVLEAEDKFHVFSFYISDPETLKCCKEKVSEMRAALQRKSGE